MMTRRLRFAFPLPERRTSRWIDDARQDLRHALRQHARAPGFAALVVATVAIGIGANATMAGVIDGLLLRPPADVRDPGHVVRLVNTGRLPSGERFANAGMSLPDVLDVDRESSAFAALGGSVGTFLSLGSGPDAIRVRCSLVTARFFEILGARPAVGRFFGARDGLPADAAEGGPPLAVLGYGFWQRQFGGDPSLIGRPLHIGRLSYTVIGVAPRGFRGLEIDTPDLWLPASVAAPVEIPRNWYAGRGSPWVSAFGRLQPGATAEEASRQATDIVRRHNSEPTSAEWRVVAASIIRGRGPDAPREVRVALWLGGVSLLVLLIACANVANLLLGRAFARRREIAVRLALGAGRTRLFRQLMTESSLLVTAGAAGALVLAAGGGRLLRSLFVMDLSATRLIDVRVLLFTSIIALGTGTLISFAPLLQARSLDLTKALRTGATAGGERSSLLRAALLGTQAALCMMLLVAAGLFALSLRRVEGLDTGMDPSRTLMVRLDLNRSLLPVAAQYDATVEAIITRVRAIPGVTGAVQEVSAGAVAPRSLATRDRDWWAMSDRAAYLMAVDSGYFRTLGATSLLGRDFMSTDRKGSPRVAIVTEPLARLLWPGESAVGQCLVYSMWGDSRDGCVTVVGVIGGFHSYDLLDRGTLLLYIPMAQRAQTIVRPTVMYVGVRGDPAQAAPAIRRAVQGARADLPAVTVTTMQEELAPQYRPWRLAALMFELFGGVALTIAIVGLYGVVAFTAAQRRHEVAVRIALGARTRHVLRTIAGSGLAVVAGGLALGAGLALAVRRWIGALLYKTSPSDPRIIAGMAVLLLAVAFAASLIPVLRALRRNPAAILKSE